ncbi:MAG: DUF1413 domain-containing protein [Anaerostipes sp.]|jgi:hypothetical protein|uniref:DUF1413 domain-containing protein n=1 Tax=Blautia producta TaxID=33035 RepID=UPI001022F737|nr:DUF1413 domain-containing protein [Blautia producta]
MLDKDVKKNQSYLFFNINKLLDETVQETENLEEWEIFLVKDLFKGYIWNRIAVKDRILLGTLFLHYVNQGKNYLHAINKTSSHHQQIKLRISFMISSI